MLYVLIGMGLLFVAIGFILTVNNAKSLLSGYNTMSEEEQARVDIRSYVPFFRKFHLFLGASLIGIGLVLYYYAGEHVAGIFLGVYPILAYIYFMIAGGKYKLASTGVGRKWGNASVYILIGTLVFVLVLFGIGMLEDQLIVGDGSLEIKGMYSETLKTADITSIELVEKLPRITYKTNGFAMGHINKGYFKTDQGEVVKLILNAKNPPYILLTKNNGKKVYYSLKEGSNADLFQQIKASLPKIGY